jgi:hypothetical protein
MSQPTLWSAGVREPSVADLDGLLAGPGHIAVRGESARIGVVVPPSRVERLEVALADELGLTAERAEVTHESAVALRTPWLPELRAMASAWQSGAVTRPPPGWSLDGPRLRWWCLAAGSAQDSTYLLRLGPTSDIAWPGIGAALSTAGVTGALVGSRAGGPAYRVVGRRRLLRLRELVGDPPTGVPDTDWPPLIHP